MFGYNKWGRYFSLTASCWYWCTPYRGLSPTGQAGGATGGGSLNMSWEA